MPTFLSGLKHQFSLKLPKDHAKNVNKLIGFKGRRGDIQRTMFDRKNNRFIQSSSFKLFIYPRSLTKQKSLEEIRKEIKIFHNRVKPIDERTRFIMNMAPRFKQRDHEGIGIRKRFDKISSRLTPTEKMKFWQDEYDKYTDESCIRFVVMSTKKIIGLKAVNRNRIRRRINAACRDVLSFYVQKDWDLVFYATPISLLQPFEHLRIEIASALRILKINSSKLPYYENLSSNKDKYPIFALNSGKRECIFLLIYHMVMHMHYIQRFH